MKGDVRKGPGDFTAPDPIEINRAPYVQELVESNTFRVEVIGNHGQEIADAYKAGDHLPHTLDVLIEDYAESVINQAMADTNDNTRRGLHSACAEMVSRYTRYDRRSAA